MSLEWTADAPHWQLTAEGAWRPTVTGYSLTAQPGQPQLPFVSRLIAVPPGSQPSVEVVSLAQVEQAAPGPLAVAPAPSGFEYDASGAALGGGWAPARLDPHWRSPDHPVVITDAGSVSGVVLARVTFYPVLPMAGHLVITTQARVVIHFSATNTASSTQAAGNSLSALQASVVNPAAIASVVPPQRSAVTSQAAPPTALIEVAAPGLTAITYEALAATGFPVAQTDPARIHLRRAGAEVALQWDGNADTLFQPGERWLFYAAPRFNRYTAHDVYQLTLEAAPATRMAERPALTGVAAPGPAWVTTLVETNAIYTAQSCKCAPGRDGDRWMWDYLSSTGSPLARAYPFNLPPIAAAQPVTLTVWLLGYTQASHQVAVAANGVPLGTASWSGQQAYTFTVSAAAGVLAAGANALTLSLPGNLDGVWLDAFALQTAASATTASAGALTFTGAAAPRAYTVALNQAAGVRAYDVTDEDQPVALTAPGVNGAAVTLADPGDNAAPRRYQVVTAAAVQTPAAVRLPQPTSGAAGADYLVIAHPDFIPALGPLLALRQAQGLSVAVEDVRALYDAADGRQTPEAIHAFLSAVYQTWSPRPRFVLLVGDGTADPRRYWPGSSATFIPPFLADVDPWLGETASDNRYAVVSGPGPLPDFMLGRLPVNTLAEAQAVVAKLVRYETAPPAGWWNDRAVFVADQADLGAGDFPAMTEAWTPLLTPRTVVRAYYTPPTDLPALRQTIMAQWSAGASVMVYDGHASVRQWSGDRLFHMDDANTLYNGGRLPVALEMTCLTGSFQDIALPTLDESLLRRATGGAIGVWGATGEGVSTGHDILARAFLQAVYGAGTTRAGLAVAAAQLALFTNGQHLDLIDTFTWLGDPATVLQLTVVPGTTVFLPALHR